MKGPRHDFYSATRPLAKLLAALLLFGALIVWLMSLALPGWLWALGCLVLLACGVGVLLTSSRLLTRRHPVISVFDDRVWYRGWREQVVMLRNVAGARRVQQRRAGIPYDCLELDMVDDDEPVSIVLFALDCLPDELVALIESRIDVLQRDRVVP